MIAHIRKALAVLILLAAVVGAGSSANAHGSVSCGDVLTTSTTLKADLACDVNALRVGADGIVIDLNGHTITARPDGSGAYPAYGVDNSGGFDQVVVKDGSITGFHEAAVYFDGRGHHGIALPPIDTSRQGRLREDVARITQELAHRHEELIGRAPEQWHLLQPNWPSDGA